MAYRRVWQYGWMRRVTVSVSSVLIYGRVSDEYRTGPRVYIHHGRLYNSIIQTSMTYTLQCGEHWPLSTVRYDVGRACQLTTRSICAVYCYWRGQNGSARIACHPLPEDESSSCKLIGTPAANNDSWPELHATCLVWVGRLNYSARSKRRPDIQSKQSIPLSHLAIIPEYTV